MKKMKKNVFNWMLAAAVVCGLSLSVTSCSDDDDEPKSEEQKEQEASKFWSVVGQLVSVDDVTDEYEGKTFEATYGMPDATNATVRIVNTNDMKTAAQRFANLVDAKGIDENTASYKWSDPEIGSMTYTRGGTAAEWATVDVNIKAVPGLQKIIYREGGAGDNGKFSGKAYYRFGDVVSREVTIKYDAKKNNDQRGTVTEYWICVRPAFGPEGKEDSHWVCVNTVSDKNYKYYHGSNGTDYWLPTSMGTDKENMQNFAELLYAICYPQTWFDNVFNHHTDGKLWGYTGVPFFTDFKGANLKYHNQYFWQGVQKGWKEAGVAEKTLGMNLGALADILQTNGVRLMHKGYSWWFTSSWNCELWEAVYTSGNTDEELNMHHAEYFEWEANMQTVKFDVREMGQKTENYSAYFNGEKKYRWAIRHATGKELASDKKYDVKQAIKGVTPVYRYYDNVVPTTDLNGDPEISEATSDKPLIGYLVGKDGKFYKDADQVKKGKTEAVAVVVYVGDKFVENNRKDPDMPHYNGLAISINHVNGMPFSTSLAPDAVCFHACDDYDDFYHYRNGLKATECYENAKCTSGSHIGGHFNTHNFTTALRENNTNFSRWFIPSVGQWILVLREFGYTWDGKSANFGNIAEGYKKWYDTLEKAGIRFMPTWQMTSTEKNATEFHTILLEDDTATFVTKKKKGDYIGAYAFTAFTYGQGATDDDLLDRY